MRIYTGGHRGTEGTQKIKEVQELKVEKLKEEDRVERKRCCVEFSGQRHRGSGNRRGHGEEKTAG
jgi:hypothetical protein